MSDKYAIRIHDLSKKYKVGVRRGRRYRMFRDVVLESAKAAWNLPRKVFGPKNGVEDPQILWALKDLTFDVAPGDSLGIVGNNGAGKSTLLKILSRVTVPTTGYAHLRGRVSSLLEVGTGFHPELTGRENVYLNGAVLGMRKREIDRKFDEIVAFSEVEKFLDTPVKFYSSGMRVRLAFSVAAHLEPEILLVDEVLAVGDVAFQKKSLNRMEEVTKEGRTVIFVSHNMAAVRALCKTGIYLEQGRVKFMGDIDSTVKTYLDTGMTQRQSDAKLEFAPNSSLPFQILSVTILNQKGKIVTAFSYEHAFIINMEMVVRRQAPKSYLSVDILDEDMQPVINSYDFETEKRFVNHQPGLYSVKITVPPILVPGEYRLSIRVIRKGKWRENVLDAAQEVCPFQIIDSGSGRSQAGIKWSGKVTGQLNWQFIKNVARTPDLEKTTK